MSARDDYPAFAPLEQYDAMTREINRLRRWKTEALEVLKHWDAVGECFDLSGHLGEYTADSVLQEVTRLQEKANKPPDQLTEQLVEAALRFTFRNTLRPQADADEKLSAITRIASEIQRQWHPDKRWDTGI
jgi:hypothetical protein